jgi:hypothetical protein
MSESRTPTDIVKFRNFWSRIRARLQGNGWAVAGTVTIPIDFSTPAWEQRRVELEHWCHQYCEGRWRGWWQRRLGTAKYEFESKKSAAIFRLTFG